MTVTSITPEIPRDRWGRPQIILPDGKRAYYSRCTTVVGAYEDTYNLEQWKMRQAAIGLSLRPDLQIAVHAHKDDKKRLNDICQEALDAAASSAGATTGTALHALTEQIDRGHTIDGLPAEVVADLDAYRAATVHLEPVLIEQMMVYDAWKVAGTPDRVVEYQGKHYIADLKTGNVEFGAGKIAAQLAVYAHSAIYKMSTARDSHGADLERGLVIHLPAGSGTCEVKWVDLRAGWEIAKTCLDVRDKRKLVASQLYTPFEGKTDVTLTQALAGPRPNEAAKAFVEEGVARLQLLDQIEACTTADQVRSLWAANANRWDDIHTEAAKSHIARLPVA